LHLVTNWTDRLQKAETTLLNGLLFLQWKSS
jgi:hypothetical protein